MSPSSSAPRVPGAAYAGSGRISYIRHQRSNFAIVSLVIENGKTVSALGNWDVVRDEATYKVAGVWEEDSRYGIQLRIRSAQLSIPASAAALAGYLKGAINGMGPVISKRIAEACPDDTPPAEWLRTYPEVSKVAPEMIARAIEVIVKDGALASADIELREILRGIPGFGRGRLRKILAKWGAKSPDMIRKDPYCLRRVAGIGWRLADLVAREAFGVEPSDPRRVRAGVQAALEALEKEGHTGTPRDMALAEACDLLGFEPGELLGAVDEFDLVYRPATRAAEQRLADGAVVLSQRIIKPLKVDDEETHDLDPDQTAAVRILLGPAIGLLTGGPGTGKTTTIRALIRSAKRNGLSVCLGAPTGKAARRMIEQTGHSARTVHSLLRIEDGDNPRAGEPHEDWTRAGLIVIDEASMIDVWLGALIMDALQPGQRLILVGDLAQLTPVAPGAVLRDLAASGKVVRCHLGIVHRQQGGRLLDLIHAIGAGDCDQVEGLLAEDRPGEDLRVLRSGDDPDQIASWVQQLVSTGGNLEAAGYGEDDWQIVSPINSKHLLAVDQTNLRVQQALRDVPDESICRRRGWQHDEPCKFVAGDRVMMTKNEALKANGRRAGEGIKVVNGEQGTVLSVEYDRATLIVGFDGGAAIVPARSPRIKLAYCVTVHKAQGSEWPVVILPLHSSQPQHMISQEWMYTAASRAARVLIIVGDPAMVAAAAGRPAPRRYGATVQRMNG
jgi:exodeoxyribonuclease V alpha subunit